MCGANPMQDLTVHILAGEPLSNHRLRLNARHAQNNRSTCVHWSKSNVRMYFSQRRYRSSGTSTFLWPAAGDASYINAIRKQTQAKACVHCC